MTLDLNKEKLPREAHDLLFGVRRSFRYHSRRRQFFDRFSKAIKIISAVSGVGVITTLLSQLGKPWPITLAAIAAVFSSIDLAINTSESARLHTELARKFIALERDIVEAGKEFTERELTKFVSRRLEIEAEEPPILRVLDCICHNELIRAMGYEEKYQVKISWCQRLFSNFIDMQAHSIKCKP